MGLIVSKFGGWANASPDRIEKAAKLFENNPQRKIKINSAIGKVASDYQFLWANCLDTLKDANVEIINSDESAGIITAKIEANDLTITIIPIDLKTQTLKVTARKYLIPKPAVAQKIFLDIARDFR